MNVIVCGTRKAYEDEKTVLWLDEALDRVNASKIIHGDCPNSPDQWGQKYAEIWQIPVEAFPADWEAFGKAAGNMRNAMMAEYGKMLGNTHCVAVWDGKSAGTLNMIKEAVRHGLGVTIVPATVP